MSTWKKSHERRERRYCFDTKPSIAFLNSQASPVGRYVEVIPGDFTLMVLRLAVCTDCSFTGLKYPNCIAVGEPMFADLLEPWDPVVRVARAPVRETVHIDVDMQVAARALDWDLGILTTE